MLGPLVELGHLEILLRLLERDAHQLAAQELLLVFSQFGIVVESGMNQHARLGHLAAVVVRSARAQVLADDREFHGLRSQLAVGVPLVDLGKIVIGLGEVVAEKLDAAAHEQRLVGERAGDIVVSHLLELLDGATLPVEERLRFVEGDEDLKNYIEGLEKARDESEAEQMTTDALALEFEKFLQENEKDQGNKSD